MFVLTEMNKLTDTATLPNGQHVICQYTTDIGLHANYVEKYYSKRTMKMIKMASIDPDKVSRKDQIVMRLQKKLAEKKK